MSQTILLVDDEPVFNFIAESHIKRVNPSYEVYSVFNGKEALAYLNESLSGRLKIPSHIFLDLNMPIMNGFTFLEEFKKFSTDVQRSIQIFVVSTSVNPFDLTQAKAYGISDYINKPLSTDFLKSVLV
jgi:CheY-like chemotaxis protein